MADYRRDTMDWDAARIRRIQERTRAREEQEIPPERPRRKQRKKKRWWLRIPLYILFVGLVSALAAEAGWLLASDLCAFHQGSEQIYTVTVAETDDMEAVAEKLHETGLIRYPWFFRLFARVTKAEEIITAGTYDLSTEMDYHALLAGMRGKVTAATVKVTIPEGFNVREICALLAEKGVATEAELLDAAANAEFNFPFIDKNSKELSRLEGYLFPDTYEFYKPEKAASALNRLLTNFEHKMDNFEAELAAAEAAGRSMKDIITVASLIEKETDGEDQTNIASVIYNRLNGSGSKGGTYGILQIDAAVLYGLPGHTGAITAADLESDTPYNLYKVAGLPPTPIANPGATAIYAALRPAESGYYYYGLAKDGTHRFFNTYSEFTAFLSSGDYMGG